jgi:hypothetical protein
LTAQNTHETEFGPERAESLLKLFFVSRLIFIKIKLKKKRRTSEPNAPSLAIVGELGELEDIKIYGFGVHKKSRQVE